MTPTTDKGFALSPRWSQSPGETFISLPLLSRGKLVGAINFQHAPRVYSPHEFKLLATVGFIIGAEIGISLAQAENAALYEQLETRKVVERGRGGHDRFSHALVSPVLGR
jgi:two-component system, response regulator PdtaR